MSVFLFDLSVAFGANLINLVFFIVAVIFAKKSKAAFWILFLIGLILWGLSFYGNVSAYNEHVQYPPLYLNVEYEKENLINNFIFFFFTASPLFVIGLNRCNKHNPRPDDEVPNTIGAQQEGDAKNTRSENAVSSSPRGSYQKDDSSVSKSNSAVPTESTRYCKNCGKAMHSYSLFCSNCGSPMPKKNKDVHDNMSETQDSPSECRDNSESVDSQEKSPMNLFCRKCGAMLPEDSVYCPNCGTMKNTTSPKTHVPQQVSGADEILKYKQLLDSGIITQEEFDAKKKQLLGI